MVAFAYEAFRQARPVGKSSPSKAAHLRQVAKTLGKDPDEFIKQHQPEDTLDYPPFALLWHWEKFLELDRRRQSNGYGPQPIPYQEILAGSVLTGVTLRNWELDLFGRLDDAFLKAVSDERSQ